LQDLSWDRKNKIVIDIRASTGVTSEILSDPGAQVEPFDLFPESFLAKNVKCVSTYWTRFRCRRMQTLKPVITVGLLFSVHSKCRSWIAEFFLGKTAHSKKISNRMLIWPPDNIRTRGADFHTSSLQQLGTFSIAFQKIDGAFASSLQPSNKIPVIGSQPVGNIFLHLIRKEARKRPGKDNCHEQARRRVGRISPTGRETLG
jgi:hypothetical protein